MAKLLEKLTSEELALREQELLQSLEEETLSPSGLDIREQEIITSLETNDIEVPAESPQLLIESNPVAQQKRDNAVVGLANTEEFSVANHHDLDFGYLRISEDLKTKLGRRNPIGFTEALKDTRVNEKLPFVGSLYKMDRYANVLEAARNLTLPEEESVWDVMTPEMHFLPSSKMIPRVQAKDRRLHDIKIVEDWLIELEERQSRGITVGGRIAEGITELPAFMVEFLLTGPIFKSGSTVAKTAATKLLGRFAEKGASKLAIRVAGSAFGSVLRTGVNVPRVLAGAAENMTKGIRVSDKGAIAFADAEVTPFKSLVRSFGDLYIENLTEVSGKALGEGAAKAVQFTGGKLAGKFPVLTKFTQELGQKWIANGTSKGVTRTAAGFLKATATKIGYDGILEEMGEEQLGRILRVATGLEDVDTIIPSMEDLLVEAGIFSVPGGVILAKNQIFRKNKLDVDLETDLGKMTDVEFEAALKEPFAPIESEIEKKIITNTIKTKTEGIVANVKEAAVEEVGTIDAIRRNVSRVEDAVGHWGTAGQKVQRDLREISFRTSKNVGETTQNVKQILKGLTSKEKTTVSQLADGAISEKGQPDSLILRANMLREQLDIMQREAIGVGLRKGKLTGRAFPQIPNKKGKEFLQEAELKGAQSHRVFAWAQQKVIDGKFKTVDSAIAALQNYRKNRLRGTEGYFEGARTIELDLDMREWNTSKVLPGIIEGGWESIEGARQWGVTADGNFKDIRTSIERIRGEVGVDQANALEDYIKAQYGQSRASATAKKWSSRARSVQFIGKLSISPLTIARNMLDRYAKGMTHGTIGTNLRATIQFPPFLNKFMKTSQRIQDEMIRQGSVLGHGHLSEGFSDGGNLQNFLGQPFALSEKGNQTYIALVKKLQLESDMRSLHAMGGKTGTIGKVYDRMLTVVGKSQLQTRNRVLTNLTNDQLADALVKGKIDDDIMAEVLHRTVTDSAFPLTLATKRMWWGSRPWVQTMTQFKVWSADQMRFIYKDVLKYTVATGDPSRLARFILGTWLAGEMYNIARDFITDKDESLLSTLQDEDGRNPKAISKSMANALVDGGVVGMLADLTYGITDWTLGPTAASIESAARTGIAVKNDPATTIDGLKKFILDDVPAAKQARGLLDRMDRAFFEENNLTANYAKWRKRSFDFKKTKGQLTAFEQATGRTILGGAKRTPGPRTLSLELISRQVLVGDVEDAADYIVGIIEDTKPEKLKDLSSVFRQSAINNSPLGNIKSDDIPEFLSQFSKESQEEIKSLEVQWAKNYDKALSVAEKRIAESGFIEKLKTQLKDELKRQVK